MPTYEYRLVGQEDALETREIDAQPTPDEDVVIEGRIYRIDSVVPARMGNPNIVYVRKTTGI